MSDDVSDWLDDHIEETTLLGVCPMTEEIVEATVAEAATSGFVPMFVATPRQVDGDRGYTGWSQADLVAFIDAACEEYGYDGPYVTARDHGGPYQSTRDRGDPNVDLDRAMAYAEETFAEDLAAGFDVLHVDATADPRTEQALDLEEVVHRTVDLVEAIEDERVRRGTPTVCYEVGTEEVEGGMTDPTDFERFLDLLARRLGQSDDDLSDRVIFAVGQVGTTMRIDMENDFDPGQAERLREIAAEHDLHLKVHYTDWLSTETLARFPDLGVGAANVGPEFAAALVESLADLERRERRLLDDAGRETQASEFTETLEAVAVRDAPWQKFVPDEVARSDYEEYAAEHSWDVARCVGRYVLGDPEVVEARERLMQNLQTRGDIAPSDRLVSDVQAAIRRYVRAFDLTGTVD